MAFDYSYVLPPTGPAENAQVREMFDDVKAYVNTLISGGGTGAPNDAQYVTLVANANLTVERVLTAGTGISLTDNGAGSTVVVANTGVVAISTTNVNSSFSAPSGTITFNFSTTPTFSSLIFQSATGAIGLTPSASVFTSYNLTLPLDGGTPGYILSTNGATPTATLSWVLNTGGVTDVHGTTNQISVSATTGSVTFSTPQDIATSSIVNFKQVIVQGSHDASNPDIAIGDSNTGFYEAAGGDGFINLILNGTISTVWTPSDQMLNNTGPVKASSFKFRNGSGNIVTINPPSSFSDYTLTLPTDDGSTDYVLKTDGGGVLSWVSPGSLAGTVNTGNAGEVTYYAGTGTTVSGNSSLTTSASTLALSASNAGGTNTVTIQNTNAAASSAARLVLDVTATSVADCFISFDTNGTNHWSIGLDNSNTDAFVISNSTALGTNDVVTIPITSGAIVFGRAITTNAGVIAGSTVKSDTTNTDDLGESGTTWRTGYFGTSVNITGSTANALIVSTDQTTTEASIDNTATDGDPYLSWKLSGTRQFSMGVNDGASDVLQIGTTAIDTATMWQATAAGEITQPLQPSFLVNLSASASNVTGDGTAYTVAFDNEIFDQGSDFASNTFTAPVTGRYYLSMTIDVDQLSTTNHSEVTAAIVTSNRTYNFKFSDIPTSLTRTSIAQSVLADMDTNDTATVTLQVDGASKVVDVIGSAQASRFSGEFNKLMIEYKRIITDTEQAILQNDLLDVTDWINKAIEGKISNCLKRLAKEEHERLIKEGVEMVPSRPDLLCLSALNRKDYLNREQREI